MNDEDLKLFNRRAIRTKKELLEAVDNYLARLQEDEDIEIVRRGRAKALTELMMLFRDKIEKAPLADLDQPFCAYEVDIVDTEIELYISEYEEIKFDDDGEMEETNSVITPEIIVVSAPYISLNQFADMLGVKAGTVRQWIRRGKIRNVKKIGSEWLVASTEGTPDRGFNDGTYYCVDEDGDMSKLFPLKEGTHSISLWKEDPYSEECLATMRDSDGCKIDEIKLNRTAREKLEHALAAAEDVKFQSTFIDSITDKVSNSDCINDAIRKDAIVDFIDALDVQEEYRAILNIVACSNSVNEALENIFNCLGVSNLYEAFLDEGKKVGN